MLCVLSQRTRQSTNNAAGSGHMRGPRARTVRLREGPYRHRPRFRFSPLVSGPPGRRGERGVKPRKQGHSLDPLVDPALPTGSTRSGSCGRVGDLLDPTRLTQSRRFAVGLRNMLRY